jgi:lipopolysaccharide transport system permease protein
VKTSGLLGDRTAAPPHRIIDADRSIFRLEWEEILQGRDLFWFLSLRDIKVRFKQTVLGSAWALLKPLSLMVVFTVFLGHVVRIPTGGIPAPLFYYCSLVFWNFFVTGMNLSSESLLHNSHMLTKVHCPKLYIPAAAIAAQFVDLSMAFLSLIGLMAYSGVWPSARLLIIPLLVLIVLCTTLGMGLLFSPLIAKYRDFQNLVAVLTQMWFFMSPVVYPLELVPERWQLLYCVNPLAGAIEGMRWAVVGQGAFPAMAVGIGLVSALAVLTFGFFFFMKSSESVVDFI